eukprot:CAMPEP_0204380098 /NCGR_PEP_ID=MMETSP0469-20131031/53107_1 /ASSEMBLY_ACC=CAM_ASM_000384 /TAXON_ID=2969 /ORGANISM="Oxyrrhis marina" /LENGTH=222 /DNA_ID=CAMNT_0051371675 /DNA_START=79 /DNA_END=746 /DNA_ORIENTATION=-
MAVIGVGVGAAVAVTVTEDVGMLGLQPGPSVCCALGREVQADEKAASRRGLPGQSSGARLEDTPSTTAESGRQASEAAGRDTSQPDSAARGEGALCHASDADASSEEVLDVPGAVDDDSKMIARQAWREALAIIRRHYSHTASNGKGPPKKPRRKILGGVLRRMLARKGLVPRRARQEQGMGEAPDLQQKQTVSAGDSASGAVVLERFVPPPQSDTVELSED